MLNKELLMGNTRELRPVALTVQKYSKGAYGYAYGFDSERFGALAPVPFWGGDLRLKSLAFYSYEGFTKCEASDKESSHNIMVYISGYQDSQIEIGGTIMGDIFEFEKKVDQTVYLTFDPPRRLLGPKDTQTDLGIGYYVEEAPWEAQNAEQGTSDDGWRRGVVDSTIKFHRGLLYRSNPVGLNRSVAYPLGRKSEHGYCNDSNTSKEYPTTYTKCRTLQGHNRRWVYSRRLRQTRNSNHSESKRGVSRGALQSVISKEALYA